MVATAGETTAHRTGGTNYGVEGAKNYARAKHGPDGSAFLDSVFLPFLRNIAGKFLIDVGCGAGPWAVFAADQGAKVFGIDFQMDMLKNAKIAISDADVNGKVFLANADGAALPAREGEFDQALSINVGCNLPNQSTKHVFEPDLKLEYDKKVGFESHFEEMARVLKPYGKAIVTAPTSFGEVFTRGTREKKYVLKSIEQQLNFINIEISQIPPTLSERERKIQEDTIIKNHLNKLDDVYRATFASRDGKWVLITDEGKLKSGEKIWRKLPGLTVPNNYHHEDEYIAAAKKAGFRVVEQHHKLFRTEKERRKYNASVSTDKHLGKEYSEEAGGKPPFVVYVFEKLLPPLDPRIRIIGQVTDSESAADIAEATVHALAKQAGGQ
ncbi:MAG: class I SAM-dependent methyltransferase [Patescibacteria group bacterium]|jgi:ubiquinone/menaquinone biosynthesis C-methylase UbiE